MPRRQKYSVKKAYFFSPIEKYLFPNYDMREMVKQVLKFGDIEIEKKKLTLLKKQPM